MSSLVDRRNLYRPGRLTCQTATEFIEGAPFVRGGKIAFKLAPGQTLARSECMELQRRKGVSA